MEFALFVAMGNSAWYNANNEGGVGMVGLERESNRFAVFQAGRRIGTAELYDNPCHMSNCYVKLELERWDTGISAELFAQLREIANRPLQVMVSSDDAERVEFLTAGGFRRRRKCYEMEVCAADYRGGNPNMRLLHSHTGEPDYDRCCRKLFDYYVETHRAINPWTADYEAFVRNIPVRLVYEKRDGEITSLVFVEKNEIAYVCGTDRQTFRVFAAGVAAWMLGQYPSICFESDDCDWAAMELRSLFTNLKETSFDTYVYA